MLWAGGNSFGIYALGLERGAPPTQILDLSLTPGISPSIHDLALDIRSGLVYGVSGGAGTPNTLFTINPATSQVSLLGPLSPPNPAADPYISGLTFDGHGILYGSSRSYSDNTVNSLFTIDPQTLAIGNILPLPGHHLGTLARGPTPDSIYGADGLSLTQIALPSGSLVPIGGDVEELAYSPDLGRMFTASYATTMERYVEGIYEVDPQNGQWMLPPVFDGYYWLSPDIVYFGGLEVVPEPGIVSLLILGAVSLLRFRSRPAR